MANTLVAQVVDFIGESGGSVYWPKAHIYDATNAAILWTWIDCQNSQTLDTLVLVSTSPLVDLSTNTNVMIPKKIVGVLGDVWVSNVHNMEREDKWWRGDDPDVPKVLVMLDNDTMRAWPVADKIYTYDVYGVAWPPSVDSTNEDIVADELLKHAIAALAASTLVEDTHPELADYLFKEYTDHQHAYMVSWRNKGEGGIVNIRPAGKRQRPFGGVVKFTRQLQ